MRRLLFRRSAGHSFQNARLQNHIDLLYVVIDQINHDFCRFFSDFRGVLCNCCQRRIGAHGNRRAAKADDGQIIRDPDFVFMRKAIRADCNLIAGKENSSGSLAVLLKLTHCLISAHEIR